MAEQPKPNTATFADHLFAQYQTGNGMAYTPCQRCHTPFVTRNWAQYPPCVAPKPVAAREAKEPAEVS